MLTWIVIGFPCLGLAEEATRSAQAVVEARRLIKVELRYVEAIDLLEPALRDLDLAAPLRVEAYELLAQAYVAKGAIEKAEAAFSSLLELAPDHQLGPTVSPKIREVFERVRRRGPKAPAPRLTGVTVQVSAHQMAFAATLDDPAGRVSAVELYVRTAGDPDFRETPMQISDRALSAVLEGEHRGRTRVDYYVIAKGGAGEPLVRLGSADSPSSIFVEEAPAEPIVPAATVNGPGEERAPQSVFSRWWFWAAVGTAIAAGVGAAFVIGHRGTHTPPGTLDPIHVP